MLVVLEGIDGAGTTTQARLLVERLEARGAHAHLTREPSDGPIGKLLRQFLAGPPSECDATAMSLLFAADRADHGMREVEPMLAAGKIVVSDRWYHSSLAYQGTGEERDFIWTLNQRARRPDLTIILEVAPRVAEKRRQLAGRTEEAFDAIEMQEKVATNYNFIYQWLKHEERIRIVDGERAQEEVARDVLALVDDVREGNGSKK